jgi:hypothetical protein
MTEPAVQQLVTFIANQPGLAERLLRCHVDDGHGRCAACRTRTQVSHLWPCTIRRCATAAHHR